MTIYLALAGFISLVFGILFIIAPAGFWEKVTSFLNVPLINVEDRMKTVHNPLIGIAFCMIGTWMLYIALKFSMVWYFHALGVVILVLGLFYLFIPNWLFWLSTISGKEVVTLDKVLIASRISFGIILILASVYIFLRLLIVLGVI